MIYMLDTDTCSYIIRQNPIVISNYKKRENENTICISSITKDELLFGAKINNSSKLTQAISNLLQMVSVMDFTSDSADSSSDIRAHLQKQGKPIGEMDCLIAGCAISHNAVLITNNTKHYAKIPNLQIENWSE
ncbi:MAG: type II toxin-antitoxin system VapC family toxin [Rickettsiales bacterium]|jgi:tRNA(fMet)-specific endonuclease VapC|nr:type II toxin-antitoxin system VapC family toxin [Rickettsiales bacterium]